MNVGLLFENSNFVFPNYKEEIEKTIYGDLWLNKIINSLNLNKYEKNSFDCLVPLMCKKTEEILYRQEILKDVVNNEKIIKSLYEQIDEIVSDYGEISLKGFVIQATAAFNKAIFIFNQILPIIEKMVVYLNNNSKSFKSKGFTEYIKKLNQKFNPTFMEKIQYICNELKFAGGIFVTGGLDEDLNLSDLEIYNTKFHYKKNDVIVVRDEKRLKNCVTIESPIEYDSTIEEFTRQTDRAIKDYAAKVVPVCEEVIDFFFQTKKELSFYMAGSKLVNYLIKNKMEYCYPVPQNEKKLDCKNLYDMALSFSLDEIVGNNLSLNQKIIVISGANQGGKTTFLRSYGQALVFMQCGLIVGAESFNSGVFDGIYTHFNKEEDKEMNSGRLDEEIKRLKRITEVIKPNSMILFNESFSSTSEKEGTDVALEILGAFREFDICFSIVSHMFLLAKKLSEKYDYAEFLRAERKENGERTYRLIKEFPKETSHAIDIFNSIFNK